MRELAEILARWDANEGKPYKGSLIDWDAYEADPQSIPPLPADYGVGK